MSENDSMTEQTEKVEQTEEAVSAEKEAAADVEATEAAPAVPTVSVTAGSESATGRRKEAVARVRIVAGSGEWQVNGRTLAEYFPNKVHQQLVASPLALTGTLGQFDVIANIHGGGASGQAGALRLAVARALNDFDTEAFRPGLKKAGFLSRDARAKERKKYGLKKARKAPQYSKR